MLATYGLQGKAITYDGVKVYPTNGDFYTMGDYARQVCALENVDLVIQHFDIWTVRPGFIEDLEFPCPVVTYSPIDSVPAPRKVPLVALVLGITLL